MLLQEAMDARLREVLRKAGRVANERIRCRTRLVTPDPNTRPARTISTARITRVEVTTASKAAPSAVPAAAVAPTVPAAMSSRLPGVRKDQKQDDQDGRQRLVS